MVWLKPPWGAASPRGPYQDSLIGYPLEVGSSLKADYGAVDAHPWRG